MKQGVTDEYGDLINPPRVTDEYGDLINPPRVTDEYGDLINRPTQTPRNGNYISMIILAVILLAGWLNYENGMTDPNVESPMEIVSADFSASPTSGNAPLTVTFTDQSTGSPTSWNWNFGDGSDPVTEYNPMHTYSTAGSYTVEETVSNEAGEDTEIKTIYVTAESPMNSLSADFSASPTSGEAPLTVTFTDQSTGSPTSWNWNFGDKITTSTKQNPTHTYETAGVYTVKETITNEIGEDTEIKESYITVTAPAETPIAVLLDADFSASETSGEAPLTVSFTDESSGSPYKWEWNFGDGSDIIEVYNPTHIYKEAGVYTVKETVTNEADTDTETKTNYITVTAPKSGDTTPDYTSLPTKSEVLTFVNGYQGGSDFIETVSGDLESYHPEWKWDIWQDQYGNILISFYYYQNNPKGYESTYFDSEGNIISTKDLELTLVDSYKGA